MEIIKEDDMHRVEGLKKEGISGNYRLNWEKKGIEQFLVVSAPNKNDVILCSNEKLNTLFDRISESIINNRIITLDDTTFFYINFSELRKNGGLSIKEKPGYYAVYGCNIENHSLKSIYYTFGKENIINISVDIKINQENSYKEVKKGLLGLRGKEQIYTGYKRITVPKGINGISEYSVTYYAGNGKYAFPCPREVLENGGSFFIKADEKEDIRFTSNNSGIRII